MNLQKNKWKKSFSTYFFAKYNFLCTFAPCIVQVEFLTWRNEFTGRTLHNGKASRDALSIGHLKLPQRMSAKDNAEMMPRVC